MTLDPKKFGLAGGILWGAGMFLWTFIALFTGYGEKVLNLFVSVYPWYDVSAWGSVIGLVWGFVDGFIGCFLLAWIYKKLVR